MRMDELDPWNVAPLHEDNSLDFPGYGDKIETDIREGRKAPRVAPRVAGGRTSRVPVGPARGTVTPIEEVYGDAKNLVRNTETARRQLKRANELMHYYCGEYAARSAPDWVIKAIVSIDKAHWQTLCKYEDMASKVQGHHNSISEQLLGEMERHQREIAKLEADLERERRARMEAQAMYESAKAEGMSKLRAIETAEGMAAAAIADMAELKEALEHEKTLGRRRNSERSKRSFALKENLLKVKSELRTERKDRKGKETQMFILSQEHTKVRGESNTVQEQLTDLEDVWKRQRSHLVAQVSMLRTELAAGGRAVSVQCNGCGATVSAVVPIGAGGEPSAGAPRALHQPVWSAASPMRLPNEAVVAMYPPGEEPDREVLPRPNRPWSAVAEAEEQKRRKRALFFAEEKITELFNRSSAEARALEQELAMERDKALAERQYKPSPSKTRFHPNPHDRPKLEDMEMGVKSSGVLFARGQAWN